ncbi:hypothetical protein HF086_012379 [Spodoptera exigua]|uniref:Uncharacterized protein n=1 Tax=Spodoptera exigua TaxID=7107 RepID=A0A922M9Z9_SPOEX|nr:hypothetical protein HF086_012379 [Spodoptera exigua]
MCNAMPSKYKKVDVSCSCTKCDSVFCLAKENDLSSCSCEDCPGSDTCLFYSSLDFHGGRLDAPNAFHSSSRTLPGVVSEVARYIASSVAQLVTPQMIKSTCCATTSRTNDTGTNTIELYRKLNSVPPKYTMEQFKKTYLSQKNKVIAPILACDADICQTEQNNFLPRKIVPSDRTVDIYRTELLKQKLAAAALKNIYLPGFTSNKKPEEMNCHFDKSSKYALEKSIGYVMDVKNNNQISHCHENKPIKPVSECFETHILDSKWDTIETPGNQYSRKSQNCTCIECMEKRDEAREFDPPGYIMDLPKAKHGHNSMPCSCKVEESKPPKLCRNIPPTTQEAKCASISEFQQGGNECKSKRPCQCKSHEKNECLKCTENKSNNFDTAGYVIDLPTDRIPIKKCVDTLKINCYPHSTFFSYQYEEQNPVHKMEQKPEIESKGSCQCTNPSEKNISKSLFYSQNSKIRNTQELYQCHLEPQIYNDRKKNSCECNVSRKPRHESSGYVLELQQYQPTKNAQELVENLLVTELPDMDMFEKKECECKVKPKSKHEVPGYVFDIPKKQKCCNDDNKSSNINMGCKCKSFSSSGYIADLPKRKPRKEGCGCKGLDRNGTKSYGRVFELPKPIPKTPTKMDCKCPESSKSKFEINRLELPCNNSNKNNEACVCKGTAKCRSSSTPGYVIDLPKTGNDGCACSKPTKLPSADNKYSKRECCGGQKHEYVPCVKETNKNQEVSRNKCCEDLAQMFKTERPGYVFDLPKHKSSPRKEGCGCKGLDRNKTESYGCGFDLSKPIPKTSTKMDCKCPESSKSKFDINRLDIPCDNSKKNNESCVCKGTAKCRSSSTPGYVLDLPKTGNDGCACSKPKPTKQTCVENKYGSKCECSGGPKHGYVPCGNETYKNQEVSHNKCCEDLAQMFKTERSGYVFDLPKHKSSPRKEGCGCKGFDLPKPIPKTTTKMDCKCRESSKSKFDINRHEIPCDNSKKDNESCVCKGTAKCRSSSTPGYVLDLPKTGNDGCACSKPTKPTCVENKYSSSDCSGPPKQEYIPCRSNNQEVSRNKELIARYVLDLPTVKPQKIGNQCECCDKVNQPTYPPKPIPKRNCECSASENKVDLSKYVYELPKQRSASSSNCGCRDSKHKLKSEFHQPPCTPKPIKQKKICECSPKTKEHIMPLDLSGYVSDSNTLNKRDGACTPAKENRYVLDLAKRRSTDHKPNKCECAINKKSISNANLIYRIETTVISPETQNVCNNMLEKQLDTYDLLKNLYAPGSTSKKYIDLCKNILKTQTDTIEILKKIYLPQKEFSKSPRSSDEPTKYPHLSKDDISKIPFSKESQLTEAESEKAAKLLRTAMLGTKVMDLPYKEFDDSLVPKQSEMDKKSKLSKYDILKRIKEAYKACSCKVCECIAGKVKTETCQCKPCECNECLSYMNKTEKIKTSKNDMNVDNKYRGTSNQQMCDCKPCDCADCTRTMKKLCDSEPCHCVECKTKSIHKRQTLVVAPVGREENVQRLACTCSPCDCIECGLIHSMASNAMHEMSTGTSRHAQCRCEICLNEVCNQRDINACSCQKRKKVISKPVDQGTHDFDIRTATTNHTKPLYSRRENKSSNHDTIAMYAAVPTNYHGLTSNEDISSKDNMCNCDECEFLNYVCQKEAVMDIKSSQAFSSSRTITKSDLNVCSKSVLNSYEDCTSQRSCSCQLCKRQYDYTHHIYTSASYLSEDCECDPYECIKCGGDLMPNRYPSNTSCESVKSKPPFDNKYREEKLVTAKPLIKKGEGYPSTRKLTKQSSKPSIQASKMRPSTKISFHNKRKLK